MACKEEIPVVIALYGLWSIVFQQRWRSGLGLIGLSGVWLIVYLVVVHFASPTGQSLLTSRYDDVSTLLRHPGLLIRQNILEPQHLQYLKLLLTPAAFLPLLAPWVFVLALPSIALNLLSSDPQQYSGLFQYSAEIVPVLIFATIEAIVLILWLLQRLFAPFQERPPAAQAAETATDTVQIVPNRREATTMPLPVRLLHFGVLGLLLVAVMYSVIHEDYVFNGKMPFSSGFQWPQVTAHDDLAQQFIDMIPANASVSAQSPLLPHLSHRTSVYLFPYGDDQADYVFLDVSGDIYPFYGSTPYIHEVKRIMTNGEFGVVAAQDGYILLEKGKTPPGISPASITQNRACS
jgi:uncharacterized membrane protein